MALPLSPCMIPLLFGLVYAQADCSLTNFEPCKAEAQRFMDSTCTPLMTTNQTHYNHCLCYQAVNLGFCYGECPNNVTVQNELKGSVEPLITSRCGAVNLNPRALPKPAIWDTFIPTVTKPTTAGSTAAITTTAKSSAIMSSSSLAIILGLIGLLY